MQDGKTDYKSVTVASNATAEEFIDFYFDDITRMKWVSLLRSQSHIAVMSEKVLSASQNSKHVIFIVYLPDAGPVLLEGSSFECYAQ